MPRLRQRPRQILASFSTSDDNDVVAIDRWHLYLLAHVTVRCPWRIVSMAFGTDQHSVGFTENCGNRLSSQMGEPFDEGHQARLEPSASGCGLYRQSLGDARAAPRPKGRTDMQRA